MQKDCEEGDCFPISVVTACNLNKFHYNLLATLPRLIYPAILSTNGCLR